MVFGQSGGGAKIATMMGMPAAKGLFHRAITMSGQQVTASGPLNATTRAKAYLGKLGNPGDRRSCSRCRSRNWSMGCRRPIRSWAAASISGRCST